MRVGDFALRLHVADWGKYVSSPAHYGGDDTYPTPTPLEWGMIRIIPTPLEWGMIRIIPTPLEWGGDDTYFPPPKCAGGEKYR